MQQPCNRCYRFAEDFGDFGVLQSFLKFQTQDFPMSRGQVVNLLLNHCEYLLFLCKDARIEPRRIGRQVLGQRLCSAGRATGNSAKVVDDEVSGGFICPSLRMFDGILLLFEAEKDFLRDVFSCVEVGQ